MKRPRPLQQTLDPHRRYNRYRKVGWDIRLFDRQCHCIFMTRRANKKKNAYCVVISAAAAVHDTALPGSYRARVYTVLPLYLPAGHALMLEGLEDLRRAGEWRSSASGSRRFSTDTSRRAPLISTVPCVTTTIHTHYTISVIVNYF